MEVKKKIASIATTNIIALQTYLMHIRSIIILRILQNEHQIKLIINNLLGKKNFRLKKLKDKMLRKNSINPRSCWYKLGRSDKWWENMITGGSPEICWVKNFRLSKSAFMDLAEQLKPYIAPNPKSPNYRALSTEKKLAITLYYLKDTGSLLMTANCFGIAVNTVSSIITQVCENIVYHLGPIYISLPKTETEMRQKVAEFESKFNMIQAFGCIDGTHVPIACPVENSQDYFCYKQYYSMNVQAVCDYKGMFMRLAWKCSR
ncbi:uncharacterized protein LOC124812576 [Hydra vulgaris]|uniref:uncharacterized protein LOC124812576 n=1 Tax=Hydra vulgaris TaxID=6087 RepID=UPI001F5FA6FD|nr:uncharacterized protein LOC124812576 [Hydra vulgaris]